MANSDDSSRADTKRRRPLKPERIAEIRKKVTKDVMPKINAAIEERRVALAQIRGKHLKY